MKIGNELFQLLKEDGNMIPLYKPYMPPLPELNDILNSGALSYGRYGKEFEMKLSEYFNNKQIIATNTFNMAILVSLSVIGVKSGDEVIVSPMACLASNQPIASLGAKVVWADVDPKTGTLCPDSVKEKISSKTKAIIHNHFCGYVGYIDEINELGNLFGIPVIDDCIDAFGSEYKGNKLGNCGTDITVFSFGAARIPNTIEGGAIAFKDNTLYEKSKLVRDLGIDRKIFRDELGEINPICDICIVGYNATMSDVNSYIGLQQLKYSSKLIQRQRENAMKWENYLLECNNIRPIVREKGLPNYWIYGTLANNKRKAIEYFRKRGYYASGVHIKNNIYSIFGDNINLKGVDEFNDKFVALPSGWWVEELKL